MHSAIEVTLFCVKKRFPNGGAPEPKIVGKEETIFRRHFRYVPRPCGIFHPWGVAAQFDIFFPEQV